MVQVFYDLQLDLVFTMAVQSYSTVQVIMPCIGIVLEDVVVLGVRTRRASWYIIGMVYPHRPS